MSVAATKIATGAARMKHAPSVADLEELSNLMISTNAVGKMALDRAVLEKYQSYPDYVRPKIEHLRGLILDVASSFEDVGKLEETLKWGEPAFLTSETHSGTTIRIDWKLKNPDQYALYLNCQTTLISSFKTLFPEQFTYEGNRAIVFGINDPIPENELRVCISMALRYHLAKSMGII